MLATQGRNVAGRGGNGSLIVQEKLRAGYRNCQNDL